MTVQEKLAAATLVAKLAHCGQTDKSGEPYINHPITVATYLEDPKLKVIAVLHDIIEDTCVTYEDLYSVFGKETADHVLLLTRKHDEDYFEYIDRVKKDPVATKVKLADLHHNTLPERNTGNDSNSIKRREKYAKAVEILTETNHNKH